MFVVSLFVRRGKGGFEGGKRIGEGREECTAVTVAEGFGGTGM